MNLGIGLSFLAGQVVPAYLLGVSLIVLQIIVISSHFCVASWLFEGLAGVLGRRFPRVTVEEANQLVKEKDGLLVDVRSPEEYAMGHLSGAINVPVKAITKHKDELRQQGRPLLLYCTAGFRCHRAAKMLRREGVEQVHELGSMKQWTGIAAGWS